MDTLTLLDIQKAMSALKQNKLADEQARYDRSIKDTSILNAFWEKLRIEMKNAKDYKTASELYYFSIAIAHLAQGYYLILPESVYGKAVDELRTKWLLPEELIANLFENKHLPTVNEMK